MKDFLAGIDFFKDIANVAGMSELCPINYLIITIERFYFSFLINRRAGGASS